MKLTRIELRRLIIEQVSIPAGPSGGGGGNIDPYINIDYYDKNKDGVLSSEEERARHETIKQNKVKKARAQIGDKDFDSKTLYQIAEIVSLIDPTGVSSWPDLYKANKEYDKNPSLGNSVKLGYAWIGIIPLIGKGTKLIKIANWALSLKKSTTSPVNKPALKQVIDAGEGLWNASPKLTDVISKSGLDKFFKNGLEASPDQLRLFLKSFNIDAKKLQETLEKLASKVYNALKSIDDNSLIEKIHRQLYYLDNLIHSIVGEGMDTTMFSNVLDLTGELASKSYSKVIKNLQINESSIVINNKTLKKLIHESVEDMFNKNISRLHNASVDGIPIKIQIVDDEAGRKKGLMFRQNMPKDEGMLFIHDAPDLCGYYMKNTYIPLSIAYADDEGTIFQIEDLNPGDLTSVMSIQPALYVLEMNQGWFESNDILIGSIIEF